MMPDIFASFSRAPGFSVYFAVSNNTSLMLTISPLAVSRVWLPLNVAPWPAKDQLYEYPMQRFFRDSRLATIGAGTSEIQRNIIARGLGL